MDVTNYCEAQAARIIRDLEGGSEDERNEALELLSDRLRSLIGGSPATEPTPASEDPAETPDPAGADPADVTEGTADA